VEHELAARAGREHARCVRVAPPAGVSFGGDQHMLAESGELMTTDRTSIRRRLAVRRTAHRPPWGARKAAHRSIVAPLAAGVAATLAASIAVGVGVALARVERDRRSGRRRREAERQFGLLPQETLAMGMRRMALGQLDLAIEMLGDDDPAVSRERAVHETRKALKRLRALVRLMRDELGEDAYARETAALRDTGRRLAGARDAEVLVTTLDGLLERNPRRLGGRRGIMGLRARLAAERDRAAEAALGDPAARAQVLADLRAIRQRVWAWQLSERPGVELVEADLRRLYRQGRARRLRAKRARKDGGRALHEWRKRVKDLRYAAEMLDRRDPDAPPAGKGNAKARRSKRAPEPSSLRKLARSADDLGEALGEEHDLAVLAARIRSGRVELGRGSRRALLGLIERRRRELRKRALADGARLYRRRPKRFGRRVRRAWARAALSLR
jgi:CHAD domain